MVTAFQIRNAKSISSGRAALFRVFVRNAGRKSIKKKPEKEWDEENVIEWEKRLKYAMLRNGFRLLCRRYFASPC